MMWRTFRMSTANWMTDRQLRSVCTTTLAMLRWTNTSPGARPVIWFAGTREAEQPIHKYCGDCSCSRRLKSCVSCASISFAHARLFCSSFSRLTGSRSRSSGFPEQFAPDQPAADLGSAGADLVELRVAPQAAGRRLVDVAHAAHRLDRLARHP